MARKIRELKADLRRAGYRQVPRRGKGSHTVWAHPLVTDSITISGHDGDDARPYQEQMVRDFVERAQAADKGGQG
jgi:predicted RNA binding protein YcfA (HicA-like mRNA interferase family)